MPSNNISFGAYASTNLEKNFLPATIDVAGSSPTHTFLDVLYKVDQRWAMPYLLGEFAAARCSHRGREKQARVM